MTTRRDFLTGCSVLAAAAALEPSTLLSTPSVPRLKQLVLTDFVEHVGTRFLLARARQKNIPLELAEAKATPQRSPSGAPTLPPGEQSFSLLFRGSNGLPFEQGTYAFKHAALGRLDMFIVPVLPEEGAHCYYEVIFNRCTGPCV